MSDDVRAAAERLRAHRAAERLRAHRAAVDAAVALGRYNPGRGGALLGWHLLPDSSPYLCPYPESAGQGIAWDRFRDDQAAVVGAYLAEHPADDAEPVTAEWFEAVGWGVTVTRTVVAFEAGDLRVSGQLRDGVWHLFGRRVEGDCSLRCHTRGHVRRLLRALGVSLKEAA